MLADVPSPEIRPGTVLLRVLAAGVNFVDNLIIAGTYQVKTPTPSVPGWELATIAAGDLDPVEPTSYPLDKTIDALRDLAERRASGKLVVIP